MNGQLDEGDFGPSNGIGLKSFDAFPKTKQSYRTSQSRQGGIYTLLIGLACAYLTVTEFSRWLAGTTRYTYSVEKGVAHELQINLDVVVAMRCSELDINVQDAAGDWIIASERLTRDPTLFHIWSQPEPAKDRIAREKRERKQAAAAALVNSEKKKQQAALQEQYDRPEWKALREEMRQYSKEEDVHEYLSLAKGTRKFKKTPRLKGKEAASDACRIYGSIDGNKVQGDFHVTAKGHGYAARMDEHHIDHGHFNFSHHINELSFGPFFPNLVNPLDGSEESTEEHFHKYQYYLSVVPTIYTDKLRYLHQTTPPQLSLQQLQKELLNRRKLAAQSKPSGASAGGDEARIDFSTGQGSGLTRADRWQVRYNPFASSPHTIYTNQYAVTQQSHTVGERSVPGIFLKYDIEPILLTVSEEWGGMLGLFIRCVNVVAGVCVAGAWLVRLTDWANEVAGARRRGRGLSAGTGGAGGLIFGEKKLGMD